MLGDCIILPVSLAVPGAALTPEAAGLVPGRCPAETPMPALHLRWAQRECFLMSPEIRSCCLMPWRRPGHQQPFCSRSSACASVLRCVLIPRKRQHRALILARGKIWPWPAGVSVEEERYLQTFKLQRHSPWGGCLPFCSPMAAKKICKEMQGKHSSHRAPAFPTHSPLQQCWPLFQGVCPGKCRTWVCAGKLLLSGQKSWR